MGVKLNAPQQIELVDEIRRAISKLKQVGEMPDFVIVPMPAKIKAIRNKASRDKKWRTYLATIEIRTGARFIREGDKLTKYQKKMLEKFNNSQGVGFLHK